MSNVMIYHHRYLFPPLPRVSTQAVDPRRPQSTGYGPRVPPGHAACCRRPEVRNACHLVGCPPCWLRYFSELRRLVLEGTLLHTHYTTHYSTSQRSRLGRQRYAHCSGNCRSRGRPAIPRLAATNVCDEWQPGRLVDRWHTQHAPAHDRRMQTSAP